jgi:hypothetical protein
MRHELALQSGARLDVKSPVNGLVGDVESGILGIGLHQPTSDLLR